jgi:aminoglycoside/choline kinase family phosphotransferase
LPPRLPHVESDDRQSNKLRIVDYQDARMGPASYDLVSLLLDRQLAPPSLAEVRAQRLSFSKKDAVKDSMRSTRTTSRGSFA